MKRMLLNVFFAVLVLAVADTVDELVEMANASEYSLSVGVWSSNIGAAQRVANRIRAG